MKRGSGTYVYCLIAAGRRPPLRDVPPGLPGTGPVRLLAADDRPNRGSGAPASRPAGRLRQWLVVADAPLDRYGETALKSGLADLDWVSRAAVAHEAVIESLAPAAALLPMKLFTIFTSDERALEHIRRQHGRISALLKRVANHQEWGVRIVLDRARATAHAAVPPARRDVRTGTRYLAGKKAQRDVAAALASRAHDMTRELYDRLAHHASAARRRAAGELPGKGGPLLLDAAFLVPRSRAARFRSTARREARRLEPQGYGVTLTGPWPPYSFMES